MCVRARIGGDCVLSPTCAAHPDEVRVGRVNHVVLNGQRRARRRGGHPCASLSARGAGAPQRSPPPGTPASCGAQCSVTSMAIFLTTAGSRSSSFI
eukprot:2156628-Prymnesium_polylepis.1